MSDQVFDASGDGVVDSVVYDTNTDGYLDQVAYDQNQDGVIDGYVVDTNLDGALDTYSVDNNQNGYAEVVGVDVNADGTVDSVVVDADEDGTDDAVEAALYPSTMTIGGVPSNTTGNPMVDGMMAEHNARLNDIWLEPNPDRDGDGWNNDQDRRPSDGYRS